MGSATISERIKQSSIKIIVSLLPVQEVDGLVDQMITNKITEEYGYTWITEGILAEGYPLYTGYAADSAGYTDVKKKEKWMKAFNRALIFKTNYIFTPLSNNKPFKTSQWYDKLRYLAEEKRHPYLMMFDATSLVLDSLTRAQLKKITITPASLLALMKSGYKERVSGIDYGAFEEMNEENILGETIKLDGNNDRADYECLLSQIDNTRKSEYVIPKRILKF